ARCFNSSGYLFNFGILLILPGCQEPPSNQGRDTEWRGVAKPHPENPDWFNLWIVEEMNTVLPREVESDGTGGYLFTLPGGERRRIFPLSEAEQVSFGVPRGLFSVPEDHESNYVVPPADLPGVLHIPSREKNPASVEMKYMLVHYARNGYPWGIWRSPDDYFYGDDAHPVKVQRGRELVAGRGAALSWPEWIDSVAWNPPDEQDRWDLLKSDEPIDLERQLRAIRGGLTYADYALAYGSATSYIQEMREFFDPSVGWPAFHAVSEDHVLAFRAIMIPEKDDGDGPFIGYMRPNPEKDFYMEISATEKRPDEWIVTTTNGRWALRRLDPADVKEFTAALQDDGVDVGRLCESE
ncbi:MAG: hypothetical protein JSS74_07940, partial [Actinobacteria bacterium]|nr:hypothetical protein [Actinomycetota bacterium]